MRDRLRTTAALAALLASAACWSDIKEQDQQANDSVGAYEPAAGTDSGVPMGGPLPTPVDTGNGTARDTTAPTPPPRP